MTNEEVKAGIEAARAKGRLNAAAPQLLETLKELLRVDDEWHGSVNSEMAHARNQARAAIRLAETGKP